MRLRRGRCRLCYPASRGLAEFGLHAFPHQADIASNGAHAFSGRRDTTATLLPKAQSVFVAALRSPWLRVKPGARPSG